MGAQKQPASEALEKFFPPRYMEPEAAATGDTSVLESTLVEKWASLRGKSVHDCVRIYLTCTRKWQFFGAQLFEVQVCINFCIAIFVLNDPITKTKNAQCENFMIFLSLRFYVKSISGHVEVQNLPFQHI